MSEGIIKVDKLTKKFGKFTAVKNISFNVKKGEIFAFLGPNGAGKTTTIKMLTTLLKPSEGTIHMNGSSVTNSLEIRRQFGIVFQDSSLDDELTAFENLELHGVLYNVPKIIRRQRIETLLKLVELWEKKDQLVKRFSGGMKRRLEIARGILHHPAILFLDEPTVGLDPQTRNHLWQYIMNLNKKEKVTVFFTTHYMEEAQKSATDVAIIDHGIIITQGTPKDIMKKTKTDSLENAFLKLTGHTVREDEAGSIDNLRQMGKMWGRK